MAVSIRSISHHPQADPRAILERVPVGVYFTTFDGRIVMANAALRRILGIPEDGSLDDVAAVVASDFYVDPEDRRRWQEQIGRDGSVHAFEMRIRRTDGSIRWVRDSGRAIDDADGAFAGYEGTWEDVTDQRLAEEALHSSESRLQMLVDQLPLLIWTTDAEIRYTSMQGTGLSAIAMTADEIVGRRMQDLFGIGSDHPQISACRAALAGSAQVYRSRLRTLSFHTHVEPLRDASGSIVGIIGISLNITDRERAAEALAHSESQLAVAQRTAHLGSWETDLRTGATTCSEELLRIFGIEPDSAHLDLAVFQSLQHPDDRATMQAAMREAQRLRAAYNVDHRILRPDGSVRWLQERGEYRYDADGNPIVAIGTCFDITDRKIAEEHLFHQARHDALTGLPNRVLLYERLAVAVAEAHERESSVAVLFIDLDRFKYINDTLGHEAGDAFLKTVSRRLLACVGAQSTVARFGGDEFIVVLTGVRDLDAVAETARTIVNEFTAPVAVGETELYTTVSVGISVFPSDGSGPEQLVRCADTAMYVAKDQGRNTFHFFTSQMHAKAAERLRLETDLRRAIAREEFVLHYQPIVSPSGRVVALEALVRWQHPVKGLVSPDRFIPVAEETGLIVPLGEWVLRTACTQMRSWDANGAPPIRIAVNISGRQFGRRDLVDTVKRVLGETGIDPGRVELELTESVVMKDVETTSVLLEELKAIGVLISVDDFGTGYSSLSYLKRFPIDALKIDRTFTRDTPFDREDTAIVEAVIALAHSLNLRVVAEGVETAAQQGFLRLRKCDELQGFFFGRPVPAREIAARLVRRAAV